MDRPSGAPEGLELGVARRDENERVLVLATSADSATLLGWAGVGILLASGEGRPCEVVLAAPAFGAPTRRAAAGLRGTLPPVRLVAIPALAESPEEVQLQEFVPASADPRPRIGPARTLLDRVVRVVEGAAALTGVGDLRRAEEGFVLYVRGVLVLHLEAQGEGVSLTFLEPDKRQVHVHESNFPRWGVDLHEEVAQLARDPRLVDRSEVASDAEVDAIAARSGARVTCRWLPWNRDGRQPIEWVGVDGSGRPVLGLVRRSVGLACVPAVIGAIAGLEEDAELWTPGASGAARVVVAAREYDPRFEAALRGFGIAVERAGESAAAAEPVRPPMERERRPRRRSRRRRRYRGEAALEPTAEVGGMAAGPEGEVEELEAGAPELLSEEELAGEAELAPEEELERETTAVEEELPTEMLEAEEGEAEGEAEEVAAAEEAPSEEEELEEEPREEVEESAEEEELEQAPGLTEEEPEAALEKEPPRIRRPRAAIVVKSDVDAILAGLVLARDRRHVALFWVCPQEGLMDFFKTGATDLAEDVDICLVGFTAQPVPKDLLQTAEIYRGRIQWIDHHRWPVEDLEALRRAVGDDAIVIVEGAGGPLAAVVRVTERRSRFTDKLVDLWAHRLSENDMRKWGYRVAALLRRLASSSGDRRQEIVPILAGKPSSLPEPGEIYAEEEAWLRSHAPRVVYFGQYQMAVLHVPQHLDAAELGRRARLGTGARLSLVTRDGEETVTLVAGEEKRSMNLQGLGEQLAARLSWVEPRPGGDRALRVAVDDLSRHPERLEVLISEIARSKSILYG